MDLRAAQGGKLARTRLYYFILLAGLAVIAAIMLLLANATREENQRHYIEIDGLEIRNIIQSGIFAGISDACSVMSTDRDILAQAKGAYLPDNRNVLIKLGTVKETLAADIVYVMNGKGDTVASTRYGNNRTLTGNNYAFRPYFTEAIAGKSAVFPGVGVTTHERGIYFSCPVFDERGAPAGVLVIKKGFEAIDEIISRFSRYTAVVSPEGIVIAANRKEWLFKSLKKMSDEKMREIKAGKQFSDVEIVPLESKNGFTGSREYFAGAWHYVVRVPFIVPGWSILLAEDIGRVEALSDAQRMVFIVVSVVISLLFVSILFLLIEKTAADIVRKTEETYRDIFDNINDGIMIHDAKTFATLDVNKRLAEMYGMTVETMRALTPEQSTTDPQAKKKVIEYLKKAASGISLTFEWKAIKPDGAEMWHEVSLRKAKVSDRDVIIASVRDIDERKRMEFALNETESNYSEIFNSVQDAIIIQEVKTGRIIDINKGASEMFAIAGDAKVPETMAALSVGPEENDWSEHIEAMRKLNSDGMARFEWKLKDLAGRKFWAEIVMKKSFIGGQERVLSVYRDITYRKDQEELMKSLISELKRSNEELEQFAYVASHDLKEPLRMISSYAQLLSRRYQGKLDKDADDFIKFITDGAFNMDRLISDLLVYSRVSTRGEAFSEVDTNEVIAETLNAMKMRIEETGALITADNLPPVKADRSQVRQLFQNLIENALKFRAETRPEIRVTYVKNDNKGRFCVKDNGIGLERGNLEKIFVIFQRLHTKTQYEGTGIGLAICKRIVERHGGRIWAESAGPGRGSEFYFTLPGQPGNLKNT